MANSINRTELAAFRAYVEDHRDTIIDKTLRGAPSLRHFTPYAGVIGRLVLEADDVADIIKRWSCDFSADADLLTRKPVIVESHLQKAEMQFCPKKDFYTYKGQQVKTKMNAADYPYAKWAMDKMAEKIKTQMEFQQLFTGDQDAVGSNAGDMFNGLLTIIADDLADVSPELTPVASGVLASATIVDQIEQMDDAIDEQYKTTEMGMFVSPEVFKMYRRKYRSLAGFHPLNQDTDKMDEIQIDGSTTSLISCPGMTGSQRIILTPKSNIYYAFDDPTDAEGFEFEQDHRNLDVWCDHWFGAGFLLVDSDVLYVNDQA